MKVKWLVMDGQVMAIDVHTGEIINDTIDTLPLEYDVNDCVSEVLDDLFGSSLNTTSEINPEVRGRKPKRISNQYSSFFCNVQYCEDTGRSNMPNALDDLVYSASTTSSGNTRVPIKQLVNVMRGEELSVKSIQASLGKRRIIKGGDAPGERYCRSLLESAECLIKRVELHQERGIINLSDSTSFQFNADKLAYERSQGASNGVLCPIEFTKGDRRSIRHFARTGNDARLSQYIQNVTEHSKRMMVRIHHLISMNSF